MTLADVLAHAGVRVSEAEFARLVESVLAEVGPVPAEDPAAALSADEVAGLTAVEADLRPRGARERDPRADAAATYAAVLAGALSVGEVARALGVDASRVRHRLAARQLLGIRRTDGWRLPSWQFGVDGQVLPGLEQVLRAMPTSLHPVVVARFFATPSPDLRVGRAGVSPRDWLAGGGDPTAVVALARDLDILV
jgi:hypothetical protein